MVSAPKLAFFVSDDAIAFAPLAPAPSAAPIARRRKWNPSAASNSFAMMLPLSMLAACGGGGGGVAPTPPTAPPAAGGMITLVADVNSATAGAAAVTVAAPGVLSNDTATGGTPIVSSGQGVGAAVAVTSTTAGIITGTYGTLTLNQTGGYSYNPNLATSLGAGVARTDVFNYAAAVTGGSATGTSTLTITVTGVNDAPIAVADTANATRGTNTTANVLTNDSDPDTVGVTSVLTVTGVAAGTTVGTTGVGTVITGAFGTLNLAANGAYTYTPAAGGTTGGTDTFTYRVADNAATPLSSTATLTITVAGPAPAAATIGALLDITNQTTGTNVVRITGPTGVNAELGAAVAGSTTAVTSGAALLIGAPGIGSDAGGAYLISGLTSGAAQIMATSGTLINGLAAGARLGTSVDLGNVGGDANADILIGAPGVVQTSVANGGAAYTIYGGAGLATNLGTALNGTNGFTINGSNGGGAYSRPATSVAAEGDNTGFLVRFLGDINGDSRADILVGSPGVDFGGAAADDFGAATFVYGTAAAQPASSIYTDFASTTTVRGFIGATGITQPNENAPTAAASGNLNNAGSADFVYTSAFRDITISAVMRVDAGVAFVGFSTLNQQGGIVGGRTPSAILNGIDGYSIVGAAGGDRLGFSVAVGDLNGDGIGDIVLGAPGVDGAGTDRGAVYIVYGSAVPPTASLDLASLTGSTGTINGLTVARIDGPTTNGAGFGSSVAVGDFNGDGRADIAVGADGTGDVFLIYGRGTAANQASVNVNTPTAGVVTLLDGISNVGQTNFHISLAANFDLNGDGLSELLIGATGDNADGAAYLVFGAITSSAVPNALEGILAPEATAAQVALDNLLGGGSAITGITVGDTVFASMPLLEHLELHVNLA
jgi:VCBS repeat-containing protein